MKTFVMLIMTLIALLVSSSTSVLGQDEATWLYSYLGLSNRNTLELRQIDQLSRSRIIPLNQITTEFPLPEIATMNHSNQSIGMITAVVDSRIGDSYPYIFQMMDARSGTITPFARLALAGIEIGFDGIWNRVLWSPNSRYVVISGAVEGVPATGGSPLLGRS